MKDESDNEKDLGGKAKQRRVILHDKQQKNIILRKTSQGMVTVKVITYEMQTTTKNVLPK